uniref:Uncharacterized protein n=1 Tax=Nelumbo nucifera TaxID=4432 RepID=A0A822Y322_NELNU|nr:TPA_asm: hypothetical protein HUJ06_027851 [Nelumbo nucifera]
MRTIDQTPEKMGVGSEMGSQGYQTDLGSESNTGSARIGFSGPLSGPFTSNKRGDPETALLASRLERRWPSLGSQFSMKIRQVSQELRRITFQQ